MRATEVLIQNRPEQAGVFQGLRLDPPMFRYPFAAVVGMERAKRSLILHAVDPRIGGTLLLGHRGCAKSTLARGFADLLAHEGAEPAPFVEVPIGASEDRLLGSIQADLLVRTGEWKPQAGLLEKADGGVLYIDEINLLPDALADLLLDSAASQVHHLERDGLSRKIETRYILVGTMNPEEGDLRPQLSDRFAHGVQVEDSFSAQERVEIGRRRMAFDDAPQMFLSEWEEATQGLRKQVTAARATLLQVATPETLRLSLAERGRSVGLEGMRAELAILRTARAAAALRGASCVGEEDLEEAWDLCVGHRISTPPPDRPDNGAKPQGPNRQETASGRSPQPSAVSSPTPKEAMPSPIPLPPMQKPRVVSLPVPLHPTRHETAALHSKVTARLATSRLQGGPVQWQASLTASVRRGWTPGAPGWQWIRSAQNPVRRLWALLDASRSSGAAHFLGEVRNQLSVYLRTFKRVSLLLVKDGQVSWLVKRGTAQSALRALTNIPAAAGKSPLQSAISTLNRSVAAAAPTSKDCALVCSDGLPTLAPGQTAAQACGAIHSLLGRLAKTLPSPPLWLSPKLSRPLQAWLSKLLGGSGIRWIQLSA